MTKKLFVLLIIFVLLFLIPEILWSPLLNTILNFVKTNYVFRISSFIYWPVNLMTFCLFLQSVGLVSLLIYLIEALKQVKSQFGKIITSAGILVTVCLIFVGIFLALMSILLRNIGF